MNGNNMAIPAAATVEATNDATAPPSSDPDAAAPAAPRGWPSRRLPPNTRFFIMKSFNARDLKISMQRSLWATQPRNEGRLNEAFQTSQAVVLFCALPAYFCSVLLRYMSVADVFVIATKPRHSKFMMALGSYLIR